MIAYITKEGDVSALEQVMKANPDVTSEILHAGMTIKLPYIETVQKTDTEIRLWS